MPTNRPESPGGAGDDSIIRMGSGWVESARALVELCVEIARDLPALCGRHHEVDAHEIATGEVIKIGVE